MFFEALLLALRRAVALAPVRFASQCRCLQRVVVLSGLLGRGRSFFGGAPMSDVVEGPEPLSLMNKSVNEGDMAKLAAAARDN